MAHPEAPILVAESTDSLLAGDVVTIEPGLYVPGVGGIRLEHNYVVTAEGSRVLSQHTLALTPNPAGR
jgi:Xaa-Pro aminopeptidase